MTTIDPPNQEVIDSEERAYNYFEPTIKVWENVSFADNYYQTVTSEQPRGYRIDGADLNVDLTGRVGFREEGTSERNPHERALAWYGGTTDLSWGIKGIEATITGFNDSGKPDAGTIVIDHNANGVGWFIDSTPLDNSEFIVQDTDSFLLAAAESEADGKYDLLTTVLHELAHLYGFIDGYEGFDAIVETENGTTRFIGDDFEAVLDGEHLDKEAHPYDLLNTHLAPGMRKLPSELDVQILQTILAEESPLNPPTLGDLDLVPPRLGGQGGQLNAALTSEPLLAIANGNFNISDTTTDSFAWDTRGASGIENGQAVLTEDSPRLSNFTQAFTVPADAKVVQFKLVDVELGDGETGGLGDGENITPPDAFEVALLDTDTNESLTTTADGLTETDSLLNIQNDGTAYFSDKVRIGGASSGEIIDLNKSRTVTVDISHLAAGTEATLYFDLLGFGDVDSRVVIDDVRLSDQFLLTPIAVDDTANTTQGQAVEIDILANDTDDDGVIATNSVQIQTQPRNGSVIPRADGTVSYIPGTGFAGTDSFTYVVQDNDGQFSEPATVEVTVDNIAPEIAEIQIPDNVTEGVEFTLNTVASDAGDDQLTYTWEFDDGTTVDGQNTVRTYLDNGTYSGSVTVRDLYGDSDTQTFEIEVDNAAPVVDAGADQTINEGSAIAFTGSYSDTGINDTHTVTWDLGDGNQLTVNSNQSTVEHTYIDDGKYTATYTVTDNDGAVGSDTVEVTVNNVAPTITNLTGNSSVKEGETVNFSATANDPGNDALIYTWEFGDGETATGTDVSHIYTDNGNYTVTVTVTDDDGASTSSTLYVTVDNVAPEIVEVNGDLSLDEGNTVTYTATATDPGDDTLTYTWNLGEGTEIKGENTALTYTFLEDGKYDFNLTVTDDDGGSTEETIEITVKNVAPSIDTAATQTGDEGSLVEFAATFKDPGTDILTIAWDFGDGSPAVINSYEGSPTPYETTTSHTYAQDGIYTATVTVTDSDGAVRESTVEVTINNLPPVITSLTEDLEINEGDTANFSAVATDAGNDELTYSWDFGDRSAPVQGADATHIYSDDGDYIVTLTVTDSSQAAVSSTLNVSVNNTAPVITDLTEDLIINEGDTASLSVSATDAGDDELTYAWDFGDGTDTVMGQNIEHLSSTG